MIKFRSDGDILIRDKFSYKQILKYSAEILIGFLISAISVYGTYPFGLAFAASCSPIGFLGIILGYFFRSSDTFRYIFAVIAIFFIKKYILEKIDIPNGAKRFLTVVWAVLLAEIAGVLVINYTFNENLSFALAGLLGGFFAFVFEKAKNGDGDYPKSTNKKLFFLCFNLSLSIFFIGIISLGGIFVNAAFILVFFTVFCIADRYGFLQTASTAAILGFSLWIYSPEYAYVFGMLMLGGLLSSLLKDIHKYAIIAAFFISNALVVFYTRGDSSAFSILINVVFAGVLFVVLPDSSVNNILKYIAPPREERKYKLKKKNPKTKYKTAKSNEAFTADDAMKKVCENCKKKLVCWVKDYSYTADMFSKIKNAKTSFSIPSHFEAICPYTGELLRASKKDNTQNGSFKIISSKASKPKMGESVSGDCGGSFFTPDEKYILCIADGMGTGELAAKQSLKSANMLKKLIDNGVEKPDAIRVVNEMLLKSDKEIILGIDLTVVDLVSGVCEFFKAGAAPTFIIRQGNAYEIGTASLPIGMLEDAKFEYNKCRLVTGDYIVMISDGLINLGTKWISEFLVETCKEGDCSCFDISSGMIKKAREMKIEYKDDITVIAVQLV